MNLRALLRQDVDVAAPMLIGMRVRSDVGERVTLRITEVEAYGDSGEDEASHAFRGQTPRNSSMFLGPGHLYVYRSYGMHWCCNVVTGEQGRASAVLLRAGVIEHGEDVARVRRPKARKARDLARGPGNLCAALAFTGVLDGIDLLDPASPVRLLPHLGHVDPVIATSARIGISRERDRPWRWHEVGEPSVSR